MYISLHGYNCSSHRNSDPKFPFPPSAGLYELLAALPSQLQPHISRPEDNAFLQGMFGERSFHSLVKVKQTKKNMPELKS